jgi:hypothetical protein
VNSVPGLGKKEEDKDAADKSDDPVPEEHGVQAVPGLERGKRLERAERGKVSEEILIIYKLKKVPFKKYYLSTSDNDEQIPLTFGGNSSPLTVYRTGPTPMP